MLNLQPLPQQDQVKSYFSGRLLSASFIRGGLLQALVLAAFLLYPGLAGALPVSVEQARRGIHLAESALYMIDPDSTLSIEQAGSPLLQNKYAKLSEGVSLFGSGTFWLRFSLIANFSEPSPAARGAADTRTDAAPLPGGSGPIALRLPAGTPAAQLYVAQELTGNGGVRKWKEIGPQADGDFILPDPQKLPLTVYVKINGVPGLWFNPELLDPQHQEREGADLASYLPWILQGVLALCLLLCLLRGIGSREEWRLWASAIIGCALVQAIFLRQGTELSAIYLTTLPQLLAPGLAIMLVPHLGRHLLNSRSSRGLDYFLSIFSLIGVATALLPLIPGLGWTAKLLPLAPLLLLPLLILSVALLARRKTGALTFMLLCLLPLAGACLALCGLGLAALKGDLSHPLYLAGSNLTLWGYAAAGLVLVLSSPASSERQADFFPLNDEFLSLEALPPEVRQAEEEPELKLFQSSASLAGTSEAASYGPAPHPQTPGEREADPARPDLAAIFSDEGGIGAVRDLEPAEASAEPAGQHSGPNSGPDSGPDGAQNGGPDGGQAGEAAADGALTGPPAGPAAGSFQEGAWGGTAGSPRAERTGAAGGEWNGEEMVYIRDPEEPGLVIIKPRRSYPRALDRDSSYTAHLRERVSGAKTAETPADNGAIGLPAPQKAGFSGEQLLSELQKHQLARLEASLKPSFDGLRQNLDELKRQQSATENLTDNLEEILQSLGLALGNLDRAALGEPSEGRPSYSIFNLSNLIRKAHSETLPVAEARGVTLSWFVAPSLPLLYKGDEDSLKSAITYMLRGAVESADSGAVQLAVRQDPEGGEGAIRFSLTDSAMNPHSTRKPARLLSRAWELARASQGSFSIEFVPQRGTSIHFSLRLDPLLGGEESPDVAERPEVFPVIPPAGGLQISLLAAEAARTEPDPERPKPAADLEEENHPEGAGKSESEGVEDQTGGLNLPGQPDQSGQQEQPGQQEHPGQPDQQEQTDRTGPADKPDQAHQPGQTDQMVQVDGAEQAGQLEPTELAEPMERAPEAEEPAASGPAAIEALAELPAGDPTLSAVHLQPPLQSGAESASRPDPQAGLEAGPEADQESLPTAGADGAGATAATGPEASPISTPPDERQAEAAPERAPESAAEEDDLLELPVEAVVQHSGGEVYGPELEKIAGAGQAARPAGHPDLAELAGRADHSDPADPALLTLNMEPRAGIVIADLAASGRRIIGRRLEGLPHTRLEARNTEEIIRACAGHEVGLIILDADLPANDVKTALEAVNAAELKAGWPPVPSLCLISHASQEERMRKSGCTQCQVKTAPRAEFQALVLSLAPYPAAGENAKGTDAPESADQPADKPAAVADAAPTRPDAQPDARPDAQPDARPDAQPDAQPDARSGLLRPRPNTPESTADLFAPQQEVIEATRPEINRSEPRGNEKLDRSVPMLDLIVSSLDTEAAEQDGRAETAADMDKPAGREQAAQAQEAAPAPAASGSGLVRLSGQPGAPEEYMDETMLPLIPGFLEVLRETLHDLARGVNGRDAALVREISERMRGQGRTFGLNNLERMAACVERAAAAEDQEAISDLAEELLNLGNRYLYTLQLTHQDHEKKA